jgi:hypothetical protein
MDHIALASPGEQLIAVLDRFAASDGGEMLVMDGGRLVGTLSTADITRVLGAAARSSS